MFDTPQNFLSSPEAWARLFGGDVYQIAAPCADKDWAWFNPSIVKKNNTEEYLCAIRFAHQPWRYASMSLLAVAVVDRFGMPSSIKQLRPPENDREFVSDEPVIHRGAHDGRLFTVNDQLFCTATVWDNTKECVIAPGYTQARIALIDISPDFEWLNTAILPSPFEIVEKNWMPIQGEFSWLYMPERNIFCNLSRTDKKMSFKSVGRASDVMEGARGSSQLVPLGDGTLLGVVHYTVASTAKKLTHAYRLQYAHRFVRYDYVTKDLIGFSPLFYFISPGCIEFAAGLTLTHEGDEVIVSFGYRDTSAWLAAAPLQNVLGQMTVIPHKRTPED